MPIVTKQQATVDAILQGIENRGIDVSGVRPIPLGDRGGNWVLCIGEGWPEILVGCRGGEGGLSGIETVGHRQHPGYATHLDAAIYADVLHRTQPAKDYKPPKGRKMPESYRLAREACSKALNARKASGGSQ